MEPELIERINTLPDVTHDIFVELGKGLTTREISKLPLRHRSIKTVETHFAIAKRRIGINNLVHLRHVAFRYVTFIQQNNLVRQQLERENVRKYKLIPV